MPCTPFLLEFHKSNSNYIKIDSISFQGLYFAKCDIEIEMNVWYKIINTIIIQIEIL